MSILWRIATTLLGTIAATHPPTTPPAITLVALHPTTDNDTDTDTDSTNSEPPHATARGPPTDQPALRSRPYEPAWPGNPNQNC